MTRRFDQALQFYPFMGEPAPRLAEQGGSELTATHRQPQASLLHVHPQQRDVLVDAIPNERPDYIRFCTRHQWASDGTDRLEDVPLCPHCDVESDQRRGRLRYIQIHARVSGVV